MSASVRISGRQVDMRQAFMILQRHTWSEAGYLPGGGWNEASLAWPDPRRKRVWSHAYTRIRDRLPESGSPRKYAFV